MLCFTAVSPSQLLNKDSQPIFRQSVCNYFLHEVILVSQVNTSLSNFHSSYAIWFRTEHPLPAKQVFIVAELAWHIPCLRRCLPMGYSALLTPWLSCRRAEGLQHALWFFKRNFGNFHGDVAAGGVVPTGGTLAPDAHPEPLWSINCELRRIYVIVCESCVTR